MSIKLSDKRTVRETNADWQYMDGGELKAESIRVRYFSPSIDDVKAQKELIRKMYDDGGDWYMSNQLVSALESLPDLIDPKTNKPVKITLAFLNNQEIVNLKAIVDAIDADINPKSQPAK